MSESTERLAPTAAIAGLALMAAALLLDGAALAIDIALGRRIVRGEEVTAANLETSSSLSSAANGAVALGLMAAALGFGWWFWSAYRRLADEGQTVHQPHWAVLGWLVPGLNLVRPPAIMGELTGRSSLIAPWWVLWVAGAAIQVVLRFISPATQQGWVNWQATAFVGNVLLLGSLGCAVALVLLAGRRALAARQAAQPVPA